MKLPPLKIGDLVARVPIIQGGMGIGVSRSKLASAVANEGGVGIISGVQIGYDEPDFETNNKEANIRALKKQIKKARESTKGILGVNFLCAMNDYNELVKVAIESGIDLIISGAGLPISLPKIVEGSNCKIAPIVSSAKAANIICSLWDKRYNRIPDLIVVEGPKAGGHLGFSLEDLKIIKEEDFENIVIEVIRVIKPFEIKYNKIIPVVVAGGIFDGRDIARFMKLGAAGVQMATRFVATEECDADIRYKNTYVNAKKEDLEIVVSPVGMPGRAIKNEFACKVIKEGKQPINKCYKCLKHCNPKIAPYCISNALIEAVKGNIDKGLIFTGENCTRINKIVKVKDLISELLTEAELNYI
ncbi:NAD(P)H-dependent flavin oxidoreductase [Clostridium algidicarnis]|uniref:Probable nitronate monooxygenase n=2 Tax=Clostridium algidicarnis TaxID=37659 RepID=A0A2S6FXE9_9CLOT|nr:nitronate monooxygenase family protein [Clostridium algidicarnis]MBB6630321.1 nitronate monooxygenase [Clostridium algidicarnis]MBU3218774.1 nitronate monooxygenase family protein [Clostridium algidicarnis]MCB2285925.1 nitronate monooxygenase family protein [Clostridium algidicarnis]PPK48138.1 NAD(P)H-dependent flavin oxidoreductase YrpB (nitropropane dioxygenase family) [Clostridium algidicarnis DSM 15099]